LIASGFLCAKMTCIGSQGCGLRCLLFPTVRLSRPSSGPVGKGKSATSSLSPFSASLVRFPARRRVGSGRTPRSHPRASYARPVAFLEGDGMGFSGCCLLGRAVDAVHCTRGSLPGSWGDALAVSLPVLCSFPIAEPTAKPSARKTCAAARAAHETSLPKGGSGQFLTARGGEMGKSSPPCRKKDGRFATAKAARRLTSAWPWPFIACLVCALSVLIRLFLSLPALSVRLIHRPPSPDPIFSFLPSVFGWAV
jgi:hypothetical protein